MIWKKHNHPKYAYASLLLQLRVKALMTPRQAHRLIWNRTISDKDGAGTRKSLDLKLEQLNLVAKDDIRAAGMQNVNEKFMVKVGQSVRQKDLIGLTMREDMRVCIPKGRHMSAKSNQDFHRMLTEVHERAKVFSITPGRAYTAFPFLSKDVFDGLDVHTVHKWMNEKVKVWKGHYQKK